MLLLVPLLAAHRVTDVAALGAGLTSVVAFSLCASSMYVLNDLLDLEADREHARKSARPFASGELSVATGVVVAAALLAAGFVSSLALPVKFLQSLAAYCALA